MVSEAGGDSEIELQVEQVPYFIGLPQQTDVG